MKSFFSLLFLFFLFGTSIFAQETKKNSNQTNEWVRLNFGNDDFSFEIPSNFVYFYDKDGFLLTRSSGFSSQAYQYGQMRMFNAAAEKTVMKVEIYEVNSPKEYLNELIENQSSRAFEIIETSETIGDFKIKKLERQTVEDFSNKGDVKVSCITKFIASKKYLYVLTAAGRGAETEISKRFFSSVSFNSAQANLTGNAKIVDVSALTPITIEQIGEVVEPNKNNKSSVIPNPPVGKIENPALVFSKPRVGYTAAARKSRDKGIIRLRLVFSENGEISKIGVLSSLPHGLLRNAVFSALRIKFIPQEEENIFVSTTKVVEYIFDIY